MEAAAKIIADTHISSLTDAAAWRPRWKVISSTCLVIENLLVLVGLLFMFGRGFLGIGGSSHAYVGYAYPTYPTSTNSSAVFSPASSLEMFYGSSSGDPEIAGYIGGAIVLFSRLIHVIGLVAAAQAASHAQKLSPVSLFPLGAQANEEL
jgi:hypothetical protein